MLSKYTQLLISIKIMLYSLELQGNSKQYRTLSTLQ